MDGRGFTGRYWILLALIGALVLTCVIRLFDLQVVKGEGYNQQAQKRLVQAYPVKAPRGEIVDRYGNAFVENRMGYVVQFQKIEITGDELNDVILAAGNLVLKEGGTLANEFPIFYDKVNEFWGFTYTEGKESREQVKQAETDIQKAVRDKETQKSLCFV